MRARTGWTGVAVLAALLLGGCAGDGGTAEPGAPTSTGTGRPVEPESPPAQDEGATGPGAAEPGGDGTSLIVEVDATQGAVTRWTLECDPAGGDHPDPDAACAAVAEGGAAAFAPVPADRMCTQVFGGPQVARVTGTVDGTAVEAELSRRNGCEIARWDALAGLLGEADGALTQ